MMSGYSNVNLNGNTRYSWLGFFSVAWLH